MRRLALAWLLGALVLAPAAPAATTPATCSAKDHTHRAAQAAAFAKGMPAARRAYYRKHADKHRRKVFVAAQAKRLKALRAAASCVVPVTPVIPPVLTPTPPAPTPPAPVPPVPPPATPPPAPKPSTVTIGANVAPYVAQSTRLGVTLGDTYIRSLGAPDAWRYDVYADPDSSVLAGIWLASGLTNASTTQYVFGTLGALGVTDHDLVLLKTLASAGDPATATPSSLVVHELFHTAQNQALGTKQGTGFTTVIQTAGPIWLREGSADYFAARATGFLSQSLANADSYLDAQFPDLQLQDMATQAQSFDHQAALYPLGRLAAGMLIDDTSPTAMLEYYRQVGAGVAWPTAFQSVFGRTIDAFYAEFAAARAAP